MIARIQEEADKAADKFGPFTSAHEGYGVLAEEMMELLEAIHANDCEAVEREACQVAAVALNLARSCEGLEFGGRSGFRRP